MIIGLTSDEFVAKVGKKPDYGYGRRKRELRGFIESNFPGRKFKIAKLYDYFGPGIAEADVEALVASPETAQRISMANELRAKKGFPPLQLVTVEWMPAEDGKPISSTRIRNGEIDNEGRLVTHGPTSNPGKQFNPSN